MPSVPTVRSLVFEAYRLIPLEEDYTAALVTRGEIIAGVVKLDGGYNIGCTALAFACSSTTVAAAAAASRRERESKAVLARRNRARHTFSNILDIAFIAKASTPR